DHVEFEVRDEGFGISGEDQKQMFTAFFRVDSEEIRSVEGTGLGLVIAKGIVEIHGGQMKMESKIGIGTVFRFEIHDLDSDSPAGQAETDSPNEIAA
ncbi:MAG: sensor histidine kinase, partial [Chloroflexi bacterium]|nr:sensor histidine kinase [Chloroflexota bacterium]